MGYWAPVRFSFIQDLSTRDATQRITDKDTILADPNNPMLLTGRQIAWMIINRFKTNRFRSDFTSYADMYVLKWAGGSPDIMEAFLRSWDLLVDNLPEPKLPLDQLRGLFVDEYEQSTAMKEHVWAYKRARVIGRTQ